MNEKTKTRIGTLSAVLAALGSASLAKADLSTFNPGTLAPIHLDPSILLQSDKLIIKQIMVGSKLINVASGYNKINEYTQKPGTDNFKEYSQRVPDPKNVLDLVQSEALQIQLKTLNFIR